MSEATKANLSQEFEEYMRLCYPTGVSRSQYVESRKVFFSGAHTIMSCISKIMSQEDEDVCIEDFATLGAQVQFEIQTMIMDGAVKV